MVNGTGMNFLEFTKLEKKKKKKVFEYLNFFLIFFKLRA